MKKILFILIIALASCKKDDVKPSHRITLTVKQDSNYKMKLTYLVNGFKGQKTSFSNQIVIDTTLKSGDFIGLDVELYDSTTNSLVMGAWQETKIEDNGAMVSGVICQSQNCSTYVNYKVK